MRILLGGAQYQEGITVLEDRVYIVDDDDNLRAAIQFFLMTHQISSRHFQDGRRFVEMLPNLTKGCVLLDVRMPGMGGLEALEGMKSHLDRLPVIMMTGHGDIDSAVKAMKLGAMDFVEKPFDEDHLILSVKTALRQIGQRSAETQKRLAARERLSILTRRETEVLQYLMGGLANKAVASRLGISPRTAEMHRSNMTRRLGVKSLSEVIQLACAADLVPLH